MKPNGNPTRRAAATRGYGVLLFVNGTITHFLNSKTAIWRFGLLGLLVPPRFAGLLLLGGDGNADEVGSAAGSTGVPGAQRAVLESRHMESSLRMRPDVFDPALVAVVANPHALAKLGELVQHFFVVGNRGAPRNALQHVLIGGADDYPGVRAALSGE
jgi:hypothetical protein